MNPQKIENYRRRLLQARQELLSEIARNQEEGRGIEIATYLDAGDQAVENVSRELNFREVENERAILTSVEESLRRIDEGSYGTCAVCGGPIDEHRLDAQPWATLCIKDQVKQERGLL